MVDCRLKRNRSKVVCRERTVIGTTKYTKTELLNVLHNAVDLRPMALTPKKISSLSKIQNEISKGRIKTSETVRKRIRKYKLGRR